MIEFKTGQWIETIYQNHTRGVHQIMCIDSERRVVMLRNVDTLAPQRCTIYKYDDCEWFAADGVVVRADQKSHVNALRSALMKYSKIGGTNYGNEVSCGA